MWKVLTAIVVVCVAGLGLGFASLLWRSPDYAKLGTCSAVEIDRTYAAIEALHDWHGATLVRVNAEAAGMKPQLRTLESAIKRAANLSFDKHFSKKRTAAFACNHSYVRFTGQGPITSLPAAAGALRPKAASDEEAWKLAQCLSYAYYSPGFPQGARPEDITILRQVCASREARNIKWEKR